MSEEGEEKRNEEGQAKWGREREEKWGAEREEKWHPLLEKGLEFTGKYFDKHKKGRKTRAFGQFAGSFFFLIFFPPCNTLWQLKIC